MRGQCRLQARVRSYVLDSDGSPQVSDLEFHFPTTIANGEKKKKSLEIHRNPSCIFRCSELCKNSMLFPTKLLIVRNKLQN